ncbi:valine--tRNA ligase [Halovulum dunhuangense]|uniref:Valine--tRNA ligase n=1 Tax=Halovulum dunhuangense TaxID=1505036 RepID=A0A849L5D7_9RHOB|nr:valine--tRNA ligase [Halovulum dunhuangense]NNU81351.1 valine--tRNA ligase [Halovulum dunhuangense]
MAMEKTFDAGASEAAIAAAWDRAGAFRAGANAKPGAETFCIMIPPPNVTGSLHMGHAFNNTLQDILTRWHRMQGHDTLWQPGTDHAGIATQMVVERELAKEGKPGRREMGRDAFVARVWEQKKKSRGNIRGQLERLGASCDWSREAFTMGGAPGDPEAGSGAPNFHDAVLKVFVELYNKGIIYRGKRLVNWDPHFETAISDLEVEQVEVDGNLWRLRYQLMDGATYQHPVEWDEDGNVTATETRDYLVVATTRPETMLGDTGVAVHPDDARYAHLVGKTVRLPLTGRVVPIVADDYADPEKGTGAVKMTPAHDFNDWAVGQRQNLRVINVMGTRAQIDLEVDPGFREGMDDDTFATLKERFHGRDRYEVRDAIITIAGQEGWLDGIDPDRHMVPHGDRSKVAIEPLLTDQWFVDTKQVVQPAIDAVRDGRTRILPEQHEKVYYHWLENIEPWCISRQLWWGHQIPVWYDDQGTPYCAMSEDEARSMAGGKALTRDPDVLDTWFSSGLWPIGTLGWPEQTEELKRYFPTDVLVTGFDIIFFWVARMMMMQLELVKEVPFHTVYVHALVRDEKGKKMSKSLGNVLDPLELIDEYGADAVRFTLTAMAAMGRDLKLSTARIQGYRNFGTKLWNAARFAEMNECSPQPDFDPKSCTATVNRWIVGETARVRESVDEALTAFRFNDAANALYAHVWGKVCDWYVEFAKPLLQSDDAALVAETRATMAWAIDQCLILLHPIMPFITEQLWGDIAPRAKMLVHADWPTYTASQLADAEADAEMGWVIGLIEDIRSVRAETRVPVGAKVPLIQLDLDAAGQAALARNRALIERLARVSEFQTAAAAPKGAVTLPVPGGTFCLPLADVIDLDEERARLEKALGKLQKEMGGLKAKLSNEKFVANAPEEVVDEARARLEELEADEAKLNAAGARLAALA